MSDRIRYRNESSIAPKIFQMDVILEAGYMGWENWFS